jgi:predicted transglutaminase-like cysteine proteinase
MSELPSPPNMDFSPVSPTKSGLVPDLKRLLWGLLAFAVFCVVMIACARAEVAINVDLSAPRPDGWVQFCKEHHDECFVDGELPRLVPWTAANARLAVEVNDRVNWMVTGVTDLQQYGQGEYWTYPDHGRGDCEDYALMKRRELMAAGFPRSALLITVVRSGFGGEGHAVLSVMTDRGPMILDNQTTAVLPQAKTYHTYIKRQSASHPNRWEWIR